MYGSTGVSRSRQPNSNKDILHVRPHVNVRGPERASSASGDLVSKETKLIHSDEGLTLETSVFESFTVANLPYRPCG